MKKSNLPKNWVVCSSKSYPDKVYYFNTVTNKSSWVMPEPEADMQASPKKLGNFKKRKKMDEKIEEHSRPTTPEMTQESKRPVLKARRIRLQDVESKDIETPQMREIREKMLQKQKKLSKSVQKNSNSSTPAEKGNASDKTDNCESDVGSTKESSRDKKEKLLRQVKNTTKKAVSKQPTEDSKTNIATVESPGPSSSQSIDQNFTPQMRLLHEKIQQKKNVKSGSSRKSLMTAVQSTSSCSTTSSTSYTSGSTSSTQSSGKLRQPKKAPEPEQNTVSVMTRRRSRLSSSTTVTSTDSATCQLKILPEENKQPDPKTSLPRNSRRSAFIRGKVSEKKTEAGSDRESTSPSLTSSYEKNRANKRLIELRRSLSLERKAIEEGLPCKRMSFGTGQINGDESDANKLSKESLEIQEPLASIYKNAEVRARLLRDRVLNHQSCTSKIKRLIQHQETYEETPTENQSQLERLKDFNNDPYYEEMEWEPIEDDKIMFEVQAVRSQLCNSRPASPANVMRGNVLELAPVPGLDKCQVLYIVVDTNVFLSNLKAVEEARDTVFKTFGRPFIVIPWTVLQELDFIKDDKSSIRPQTLKTKARKAVSFLYAHFSMKHPRVLGQTSQDEEKNKGRFTIDCPDDKILQSCLQIQECGHSVVLLSYDKNLCNKAMVHDIATLGRNDPFEKVDYLNIQDSRNDSLRNNEPIIQDTAESSGSLLEEELLIAEDIFEEVKAIVQALLSPVVATEMQNLCGDAWERYTIIRPPWSSIDVLKCGIKHWMAAVSESFTQRAEPILKELLDAFIHAPVGGRKLKDVSYILERSSDLIQTLKQQKYPNLLQKSLSTINDLKKKCFEETKQLCEKRIRDEIGHDNIIARQDLRAEAALEHLNKVYAFARDFCGIAAETINMPCPFVYQKIDKRLTYDFVKDYQPVVAANLNRLLQVLSLALEDINGLRPNHRSVLALADALKTFFPDEFSDPTEEVEPMDLYYCIKNKEDVMKRGLAQLQDLSAQFCRMASFRCK